MATADRPTLAAPPRLPRVPARLADHVGDDLDDLYPDVDAVALDGTSLSLPEARTLDVLRSRLRSCALEVPTDATLGLQDVELEGTDLTGHRIDSAVRVRFVRCRLVGADLSEAALHDVTFDDCALDLASWRAARLRRVALRGGRIDGLDASGARFEDVSVVGLPIGAMTLDGTRCERVDLTDADLTGVDPRVLTGATISAPQAVALAPRLARGLGIVVADSEVSP